METERTAAISISASGDNLVIAAPGVGKAIYIDHVNVYPNGAVNVTLYNGAATDNKALSGTYQLTTGQALVFDNSGVLEHGILECSPNKAFNINLSGAVSVVGFVRYRIYNE